MTRTSSPFTQRSTRCATAPRSRRTPGAPWQSAIACQAAALRPHVGKWVALSSPTDVLVAADTPEEVLSWLAKHERQATFGMFRVPGSEAEAAGAAPL